MFFKSLKLLKIEREVKEHMYANNIQFLHINFSEKLGSLILCENYGRLALLLHKVCPGKGSQKFLRSKFEFNRISVECRTSQQILIPPSRERVAWTKTVLHFFALCKQPISSLQNCKLVENVPTYVQCKYLKRRRLIEINYWIGTQNNSLMDKFYACTAEKIWNLGIKTYLYFNLYVYGFMLTFLWMYLPMDESTYIK